MSNDAPFIEPRENGPLVVKNVRVLRLPDGTLAEEKVVRALCRCGHSRNKPYCDGSHNDAGFDGSASDVSHRDRVYAYEGVETTVFYNKLLCSHAGECGRRLKTVFDTEKRPWVQPDNGTREQIAEVIAACPSGALRYSRPGEPPEGIAGQEVSITVERNGPYRVSNVGIDAAYWAEGQGPSKYVLCRCGQSKNKPFCDGTHHDVGWSDGSDAETTPKD